MPSHRHLAAAFAALLCCAQTATAAAPPAAAAALPAGSILQMFAGLAAVLALVGVAAWLLKRFSGFRGTGSGLIRIVGGAAVGQRERIVLVEIEEQWLVLGVAPGQVRTLHTMPRAQSAPSTGALPSAPGDASFPAWLRRVTERRSHG